MKSLLILLKLGVGNIENRQGKNIINNEHSYLDIKVDPK